MRAVVKDHILVLIPETEEETAALSAWTAGRDGHVLHAAVPQSGALELRDLGPEADACREPINIISDSPDPAIRPIGNFATAPFELDGQRYMSVESFWQGLKFASPADRRRLAGYEGPRARAEGDTQGYGASVSYGGEEIPVGTWRHWRLMEQACRAKFTQNAEARAALLATGERPLQHIVHRDSKAIPGVVMADIWTRIRAALRASDAHTSL